MSMNGWYAFDLDGTLAEYERWIGPEHIGEPILKRVNQVKKMLAEGKDVRIFTARIFPLDTLMENQTAYQARVNDALTAKKYIHAWCLKHIGVLLPVTCIKDYGMVKLWDDRAVQVFPNTGDTLEERIAELEARLQVFWE